MTHKPDPGRGRCEPLERRLLLATFSVTTTADSGAGSLRQAILDANAAPDADVIRFNIAAGSGTVKTISPASALPSVSAPLTIDGTTQPGYVGTPLVELSGNLVTTFRSGLVIAAPAPGSVVRGLAINRWLASGIQIYTAGCLVEKNYLGTDPAGASARRNGTGLYLSGSSTMPATNCRVSSNLISGNGEGVYLSGPGAQNNVFVANRIGLNAAGTAAVPNENAGIALVEGPANNRIGGPQVEDLNVIAGNNADGIRLTGPGNVVTGNLIGVRLNPPAPPAALPNGGNGIVVAYASAGVSITGNTIAHNGGAGVLVGVGDRIGITKNQMFSNFNGGIDLGGNGPTPNDPGDADAGPNGLQNYPVITSAVVTGDRTMVLGTLDSLPSQRYRIDLFGSAGTQVDSSGFGEGARFLAPTEVTTDAAGHADFAASLVSAPAGDVITATASRIVGQDLETSEFSRGVAVSASSGPFVRQVYVRNSTWTSAFQSYLQARGMGSTRFGYAVPDGPAQLAVLPWADIDRISIQFSEPLRVLATDLTVQGVGRSNYPVAVNVFSYDAPNRTATWALAAPISADRVVLHLEGDAPGGIVSGSRLLDGEWANGQDSYPSGNGTPGGDFNFRLNILGGDVTRNGSVLADDFSQVKQKFFSSTSSPGSGAAAYSPFHDVNGSGSILADDFSEVKRRFFANLPAGEPAITAALGWGVAPVRREVLLVTAC